MNLSLCYNLTNMSLTRILEDYYFATVNRTEDELHEVSRKLIRKIYKRQDAFVLNNVLKSKINCLSDTVLEFQEMELLWFLTDHCHLMRILEDPEAPSVVFDMRFESYSMYFINWLEKENINMTRFEKSLKKNFTSIINLIEETNTYNLSAETDSLTSQIINMTFREKQSLYIYAFFKFQFDLGESEYE